MLNGALATTNVTRCFRSHAWTSLSRFHTSRTWQGITSSVPLDTGTPTPDGPAVTQTNRAEVTLKRFWKTVGVETRDGAYAVTLDKRPLKTPSGNKLRVPHEKSLVATLIASEWENQEQLIKPHALPMTSIVSRAIDAMHDEETRSQVRAALLKYLNTDTICFHEHNAFPQLDAQQKTHWNPLLEWARSTYGIKIDVFDSVLSHPQPVETHKKLDEVLAGFNAWEMAAMERVTYATKSFIIALGLVTRKLTVEDAALAASVEVNAQIERWGEVEDTHDVDYQDVRRQLGSAALLLSKV